MWKYTSINSYPDIILHDCYIDKIRVEEGSLFFCFDDRGFWLLQGNEHNPFENTVRTGNAEVELVNADITDACVKIFRNRRLFKGFLFTSIREMTIMNFLEMIKTNQCKYEMVDEYYASCGAMFCGYTYSKRRGRPEYTQIEVRHDKRIYYWNEICANRTW